MVIHLRIYFGQERRNKRVHGIALFLKAMPSVVLRPAAVRAEARLATGAAPVALRAKGLLDPRAVAVAPAAKAALPARAGALNVVACGVGACHQAIYGEHVSPKRETKIPPTVVLGVYVTGWPGETSIRESRPIGIDRVLLSE